ncbi:MAG TPA: site-specific integrase [Acidimicrobiales bacterium]
MGWIEKRPRAKGVAWKAATRGPDGQVRSKTFERQADARRWLSTQEASIAQGAWIDPTAGRVTFGAYAEVWLAAQAHHRPSTRAKVESHLRCHIIPAFGDRPIGSIRPSEVKSWVASLAGVLAPATVEIVYRYLAAVFRAAVSDRVLAVTPCVGVKLPKIDRPKVHPLTTEEVQALADTVPPRYRAMVILAAGTGLRQGEAFGLTLAHIDFLRRTLRVEQQLILLGAEPIVGPPKTAASRRTVPLPDVVLDALARHVAEYPPGPDGFLFTDDRARPLRRNRFNEVWHRATAAAAVPEGTGFHDLRHYYASLLIRYGESVKVVQDRLGHASAMETLDTYGHLWPDSDDRTRTAVDSVLGRGSTSTSDHVATESC